MGFDNKNSKRATHANIPHHENKKSIIIEEQTQGKKFRIMILNDKFVYADEDQKPVLTGNGQSTIQELISNYHNLHDVRPIKLVNEELINQQGYELTDILENGKRLEITNVVSVANDGKQVYIEEYDIHPVIERRISAQMNAKNNRKYLSTV